MKTISREAWGRAKRLGYGAIWDGRRYLFNSATNAWQEVRVSP